MSVRIVALIFALLSSTVNAQGPSTPSLDAALGQFQRGEAEAALVSFEALRRGGEQEPADLARIERYLGVLYASLGEDERASSAFARSLAIDPEQSTPDEIGPQQQASFRAAKQARAGAGLEVSVTRAESSYRIQIMGAPMGWVERVEASYGGHNEVADDDVIDLEPSPAEWLGERLVVRLVAQDEFGNVLFRRRVELERERVVEPARSRGLVIGVILGSIALVAGGVIAAVLISGRENGFEEGGSVMWELGSP